MRGTLNLIYHHPKDGNKKPPESGSLRLVFKFPYLVHEAFI